MGLLLGILAGAVVGLRLAWQRESWRAAAYRRALLLPGLGKALKNLATARFARSLAIGYRVGLPVTEALTLAAQNTGSPVLEAGIPAAVENLLDGASLADCLASVEFFPPLMVHSLKAAEESGQVDGMMEWTARLYDLGLESSLQSFLAMIEPGLMLSMGILVGLVLLATLLPMVNVLQSL
jgi:type IV pilus assembly protein PilC